MQVLDNYRYLKGANEVYRQYFQQAVLLCLLKALYYAGICSYAAPNGECLSQDPLCYFLQLSNSQTTHALKVQPRAPWIICSLLRYS